MRRGPRREANDAGLGPALGLTRERGGARDRQVQPQGRVHDLLGPARRVVDRRQQLGRRHDHRRVCAPCPCPLFRAARRWREAVTAAHIRAIARPASWSTEEPAAGLAPPRRRRRGVTASPRPRSHGRPLSQWRSAAIENIKKRAQVGLKIRQGRRRLVGRHRSGPGHVVSRFVRPAHHCSGSTRRRRLRVLVRLHARGLHAGGRDLRALDLFAGEDRGR